MLSLFFLIRVKLAISLCNVIVCDFCFWHGLLEMSVGKICCSSSLAFFIRIGCKNGKGLGGVCLRQGGFGLMGMLAGCF